MTVTRTLALALATTAALAVLAPAAQATTAADSAATAWGPYYAPAHGAKAAGTLKATGEDHADLPTADVVHISGTVRDYTRAPATCGWAVFRITYRSGDNLPFKHHSIRDCSYRTPKHFSFKHRDVYQVDIKVCAAAKTTKPTLNCLYAGTWKTLYLSK